MWQQYWGLRADPFTGPDPCYVSTPGHDEAVARLVEAVDSAGRRAALRAGAGLGKSVVLGRAVSLVRGPRRRVARVSGAIDGAGLYAGLAAGLGVARRPGHLDRPAAWRSLSDAARLCRWQGLHAVLVIDDAQALDTPGDRRDLARLTHLDPNPAARLTVLLAYRDDGEGDGQEVDDADPGPLEPGDLRVGLPPLTRGETADYLSEKLKAAGRPRGAFTESGSHRLHELSGGVPRAVDRLAVLGLMAAALRGLDAVPAAVVDDVAPQCVLPGRVAAA